MINVFIYRELLDLLDPRVLRVHLALLEPLVDLAEAMVATVLLPLPLLLLCLVLLVLQVLLVPQERRVMLELQDRMVLLVDLEIPAPLAVMVLPAHKDPLAPMEPQETPADQVLLDLKEVETFFHFLVYYFHINSNFKLIN